MTDDTSIHKQISRQEMDTLLVHLLRCEELMLNGIDKIQDSDFEAPHEFAHQWLWSIASKYFKKYKQLIPQEALATEFAALAQNYPEYQNPELQQSFFELAAQAYHAPAGKLLPLYAQDILRSFLWQRRVGRSIVAVAQTGLITSRIWENIRSKEKAVQISTTNEHMPFSKNKGPMLGVAPRDNTGVRFVDSLLSGGTRVGDLIGFLAPSGGGKTTLTHQLAVECAMRSRHALVISYEQPLDPEYFIPVYSYATRIPRNKFDVSPDPEIVRKNLTEQEAHEFSRAMDNVNEYLHYADFSGTNDHSGQGGASEIDAYLLSFTKRHGTPPHMVAIDWFWPMVTRSYNTIDLGFGKRLDIRVYAQGVVEELKRLASKHNCWIWLPHQLAPSEGRKHRDMEFEDAAELKSFAWYTTGCLCFGCMDDSHTGTIKFSKARNAKVDKKVVKLLGNISRFVELDHDMVYDKSTSRFVPKDKINSIPDAEGRTSSVQRDYEGAACTQF